MVFEIRADLGLIAAVLAGLLWVGTLYNQLVSWAQRRGYAEGYTSLLVVGGVLLTLAGLAILSIGAAALALAVFVASGTPMVVGSICRYVQRREAAMKAIRDEAHGDPGA